MTREPLCAVHSCGSRPAISLPTGYVGIFDATNTTLDRRAAVLERCLRHFGADPAASTASASPTGLAAKPPVQVVFIESICDDPVILDRNYDMKLSNADYKGQDPAAARADFLARVAKYEKVYEPIDAREDKLSYIKILNVGQRVRQLLWGVVCTVACLSLLLSLRLRLCLARLPSTAAVGTWCLRSHPVCVTCTLSLGSSGCCGMASQRTTRVA